MSNNPNDKDALPKGSHQQTLTYLYTHNSLSPMHTPDDQFKREWECAGQAMSDLKCECGSSITYGPECPVEFHTEGCPLYKGRPVV